jgi:uncharacterized membrane protein (UPF0127 family)
MAVIRIASGRTLWPEFIPAVTPWQKFKGIMLMTPAAFTIPLLFSFEKPAKAANAIHSLFCLARFDAIYLDEHRKIVEIIEDVRPWKPWIEPREPVQYLIECPAGQSNKLKLREGDLLSW